MFAQGWVRVHAEFIGQKFMVTMEKKPSSLATTGFCLPWVCIMCLWSGQNQFCPWRPLP